MYKFGQPVGQYIGHYMTNIYIGPTGPILIGPNNIWPLTKYLYLVLGRSPNIYIYSIYIYILYIFAQNIYFGRDPKFWPGPKVLKYIYIKYIYILSDFWPNLFGQPFGQYLLSKFLIWTLVQIYIFEQIYIYIIYIYIDYIFWPIILAKIFYFWPNRPKF